MAQPIQKAPKFAQLKMPLSDADAYQYLESDKAGAVRLLQIGASWAGKNTRIVTQKNISATLLTWSFVTVKSYVVDIGV